MFGSDIISDLTVKQTERVSLGCFIYTILPHPTCKLMLHSVIYDAEQMSGAKNNQNFSNIHFQCAILQTNWLFYLPSELQKVTN